MDFLTIVACFCQNFVSNVIWAHLWIIQQACGVTELSLKKLLRKGKEQAPNKESH